MPNFSRVSQERLKTCHPDLQTLFWEVIKGFDCTIISGARTVKEQQELYKIGRKKVNGSWKVVGKVVTYKDGIIFKSAHQPLDLPPSDPLYGKSFAVDAVPYPIDWDDIYRHLYFAGYVKGIADRLYREGVISHTIISGADFDGDTLFSPTKWMDLPHFQLTTKC